MAESRDVCQICYRSTSHKANPTVTLESKSTYDASAKKKKCNVCRQGWAPIKIAKDSASGRYVEIRIRPKIPPNIDYQLCKNCQSKIECPKGLECSFAHSKAELAIWNAERQTEPRPAPPINGPYQYQLCKHMINTGNCPYGQRCTFAHSEDEWKQWLRTQTGGETNERVITGFGYSNPQPTVGGVVNSIDYKCDSCGLTCTSMKQLEDHLSGSRHRQNVNKPTGQYQQYAPPPRAISGSGHFRRRPTLAFPINGYKMCLHIQAGRRCIYGDFCTFSHTQLELDEWNKQLQVASQSRASPHINRFQSSGGVPQASAGEVSVAGSASGLDDFEEEGLPPDSGDFGAAVRNKLLEEHKKETLAELETTCEGVTISEVSGRDLCLLWSQATAVDWVFEITSATPRALHSVTLFDSFLTDYDITGACLITPGGTQKLSVLLKSEKGVGILLNQKFNPSDKIQLRVTLVPRSGLLGQLVVFNFGSFTMVRGLAVHVLTEQETKSLDNDRRKARRKPDLFWEQRHGVISMDQFMEETDRDLPEFALPEQIERFIEKGTYRNVENRVTRENYQRRMHNLLYLEEYRQREDMSRYDLYDIEATPTRDYSTLNGTTFATPGYCYLKLPLEEAIFEGGRTVRKGDSALLLPSNQQVAHECNVEHVAKEGVVLKITDTAKQACVNAGGRCSVRFVLGRIHMRSMHHAVDQLDLATIFPTPCDGNTMNERSSTVMECLKELKRSELNQSQQEAITSMLDPACTRVPSLVLGPFGCGKTRTLNECIKLLASHVTEARILICTHSNSAANLYVESLHREWNDCYHSPAPMFRVYYTGRNIATIPLNVRLYCKFNERSLAVPTVADLQSHKIVVATLSTSRAIFLSKLPRGHFTHIFIDEAAQALESEAIIPLCLATSRTKIVLAGDHMQMDPPVHSPIARKYGLHVSLLERLYDYVAYDSGVGMLCKTLLTENHRSHSQILELPSKLFYKNKLTCKAVFPETGPRDFPPIKFVGVTGRECQDEDSPSYYNQDEALKIVEQVILLVKGGLHMTDICVLSYYALQVRRIRDLLRKKGLRSVQVFRVDDVQGKEYRALLISTVRTCSTEPPAEEEAGFLTNPKMFNTAVTRAKQWLVVVGEPFTLCTVGENRLCWMEYIRCCQQLGSFDYTNADQFIEESLDYKIVVRQVLEKAHSTFFSPHKSHTPTPVTPAPSHLTPAVYMGATPQQKVEILRSKIKLVTQNGDESTIKKITDELLRMSVEQQSSLIVKPELFQGKVREIEQVFRRAGPTAAILNSNRMEAPLLSQTTTPVGQSAPQPAQGSGFNGAVGSNVSMVVPNANGGLAALASDLPPYLRSSMESVVVYARWVDHMMQSPLVASSEVVRENILRQKANVGHQLRLVNEQIFLYREVGKLIQQQVRPPPQPQGPHPFQPVSNHMFVPPPTTRPPPQFPPPQSSQSYQLFSQPPSNPGIQTTSRSMGTVPTGNHGNSAFSYGVSALLPNPTEQKHSQKPKPIFVAGKVKGGRTMNTTTPLDAAISANSAPSVHRSDQELYVSDDELFTN